MISLLRAFARESFFEVVARYKGTRISEIEFRDQWMLRIKSRGLSFCGGWYSPPPNGCAVLFDNGNDGRRVSFDTLRSKNYWPSNKKIEWEDAIIFGYVSPVDLKSGMMGDCSMFQYFGENPIIKEHIQHCKEANRQILSKIEVEMTSLELYEMAMDIIDKSNLYIYGHSQTDGDDLNLGHSFSSIISKSFAPLQDLKKNDIDFLSQSRRFINSVDDWQLSEVPAFTFEPRLFRKNELHLPLVSLHTLVSIKNGKLKVQT